VRLLLDTHVLLWWLDDAPALSEQARHAISGEPVVLVSAASVWEAAIKRRLGKLDADFDFEAEIAAEGFHALPITVRHAVAAAALPPHHSDPFDRMLVAQAKLEELVLITRDRYIQKYDVQVMPA